MVKIIKTKTNYSCEICNQKYDKKIDALACESQGITGKDIRPGLILIRLNTSRKNLYENSIIILGKESRYLKPILKHHKVYRVGLVSFSQGRGEYDWDRWTEDAKKYQELDDMIKNKKLRPSTNIEIKELTNYLEDWEEKIARALKEPFSGPEPYKGCLEPEILNTIQKYHLTLHNTSPF